MAAARIRPMDEADVPAVNDVAVAAFSDLNARTGAAPYAGAPPAAASVRLRRLLETDPGGAWVADRDGEVTGAALAFVRERLWGLSLFVVAPGAQSGGIGRELLARAWDHGRDARGHAILASRDPRALRAYVRLGLDLHPALDARGVPRGAVAPDGLRAWEPSDSGWAEPLTRRVRGAAHGGDLEALLEAGLLATVLPGRGYAFARGTDLKLLAADDEDAARTLLAGHLARAGEEPAGVEWITGAQQWAVRACVEAGLELHAHGAVLTGGELGPMRPYLPSGPYL
jgi:GNAT superfamily N-acetyltransferase